QAVANDHCPSPRGRRDWVRRVPVGNHTAEISVAIWTASLRLRASIEKVHGPGKQLRWRRRAGGYCEELRALPIVQWHSQFRSIPVRIRFSNHLELGDSSPILDFLVRGGRPNLWSNDEEAMRSHRTANLGHLRACGRHMSAASFLTLHLSGSEDPS